MTVPLPEELPPRFEFGGYIIHDCIGRGGMARVYRAEHTALRKPIALKVLDRWVVEKPGGAERFLREARTAAAIKHPNVVDIVDVGVWSERPFIVMELLHGCDLDSELERRGALPEAEVAGLALPIIAGMIAVHDAGVVHRDIKPSNIFLASGSDGEIVPKVLDFGISKFSDHLLEPMQGLTGTREIVGTPTYMAPEALNGARELGPKADQYAIGAVLYDCATGRPPFEGETLLELLKLIAVGDVPPPRSLRPEISTVLENAIQRAMSRDPAQRFETLRDLGRELWPLADERTRMIWERSFGRSTISREQTTQSLVGKKPRSRPAQPRRRGWWLPASLAGTILLGGGYWFLRGNGSPDPASVEQVASLAPRGELGVSTPAEPPAVVPSESSPLATQSREPSPAEAVSEPAPPVAEASGKRPKALARAGSPRRRARDAEVAPRGTDRRVGLVAARRDAPTELDPDLDQLFAAPGAPEGRAPAATGADSELDGMFRTDQAVPIGPNGSPLLD
jgi:eukaryotic-like serine/threonine-protein kinase